MSKKYCPNFIVCYMSKCKKIQIINNDKKIMLGIQISGTGLGIEVLFSLDTYMRW